MRTFRDFMESALYDPESGFYSTRTKTADFYTAPELHPAFGGVLADRVAALLRRVRAARPSENLTLVEAGCGDGTLVTQVVRRLREAHPDVSENLRVALVERSRRDLTDAVRRLTAFGLTVDACTGIEKLLRFTGVLYTNELLDALPAHVLSKSGGIMKEVYVDDEDREALGPISLPELADSAARIAPALAEGEKHAVSLAAGQWLKDAAQKLTAGFIVTADYGKRFAPDAPNAPRGYRAHRIDFDLVAEPGTKDITVPLDFEAAIAAGRDAGLELEGYESLSRYLIDGGIQKWLEAASGPDAALYKERAQIKTLIHPEGMGEAFKVLTQRKSL